MWAVWRFSKYFMYSYRPFNFDGILLMSKVATNWNKTVSNVFLVVCRCYHRHVTWEEFQTFYSLHNFQWHFDKLFSGNFQLTLLHNLFSLSCNIEKTSKYSHSHSYNNSGSCWDDSNSIILIHLEIISIARLVSILVVSTIYSKPRKKRYN